MWGRSKRKHSSLITHSLPRAQTQPRAHNIERANCSHPQQDGPKTDHPIAEPCNTPSGNVPAPRHRGLPCYTSALQRSSKLQTRRLMASHLGEESAAPNHKNTGCRLHNAVSVGSGVGPSLAMTACCREGGVAERVSGGFGPFQLRSRAGNAVCVLTRGIGVLEVCLCLRRVTTRARQFKELQQVLVGSGTLGGEASRCLTLPFLGPSRVESRRGQPTEQTHVPSCLRSVWNCSPTTDSIEPTLKQNPLWPQPSPWKYNFMSSMTSSFSISSLK